MCTGLPQLTGKRWACGTEPRSVWADVNLLFLSDCTRAKNSPPGCGQGVKAKLGPAGGEPQAQSLPETLLRGPAAGEGPGLACRACLCAQGLQPDLTERTGGSPTVRTNSTARRPLAVGFKHAHTHVCMHKCAYMHTHVHSHTHAREGWTPAHRDVGGEQAVCLPPGRRLAQKERRVRSRKG